MNNQYVTVYQALVGQWSSELTQAQYHVLLFINERTLRYGKGKEKIPIRHFLEGVFAQTGDKRRVLAGVKHSKSTVTKACQALADLGLIGKAVGNDFNGTNVFAINVKRLIDGAAKLSNRLKEPKRKKERVANNLVVPQEHRGGSTEAQRGSSGAPNYKNTLSKNTLSKNTSSASPAAGIYLAVEKAKEKNALSLQKKTNRMASSGNVSMQGITALWKQLLLKHYPDVSTNLVVTPRQYGMFKASYSSTNMPIPITEFMEWAVANWQELIDHDFAWCKKTPPPRLPSLPFFSGMFKYFVTAHGNQQVRVTHRKGNQDQSVKKTRRLEQSNESLQAQLRSTQEELGRSQAESATHQRTAAKRKRIIKRTKVQAVPINELRFEDIEELPEWGK